MSIQNPKIPGDRMVGTDYSNTSNLTNTAIPTPKPVTTPIPTPKPTSSMGNLVSSTSSANTDGVIRLKFKDGHPFSSYPGIMAPLAATGGVAWLYRPLVDISRSANYDPIQIVHSIQDFKAFRNNSSATVTITGQFSAQTIEEGKYTLAVLHFMSTARLMAFGSEGSVPTGMPPPVLSLSGYGPNKMNDIPVILESFNETMPQDVDYIKVDGNDVPTLMNIAITLSVMLAPEQLRYFSLDSFASGNIQNYL